MYALRFSLLTNIYKAGFCSFSLKSCINLVSSLFMSNNSHIQSSIDTIRDPFRSSLCRYVYIVLAIVNFYPRYPNSSAFSTIFKANCACFNVLIGRLRERIVPKLNAALRSNGVSKSLVFAQFAKPNQ